MYAMVGQFGNKLGANVPLAKHLAIRLVDQLHHSTNQVANLRNICKRKITGSISPDLRRIKRRRLDRISPVRLPQFRQTGIFEPGRGNTDVETRSLHWSDGGHHGS